MEYAHPPPAFRPNKIIEQTRWIDSVHGVGSRVCVPVRRAQGPNRIGAQEAASGSIIEPSAVEVKSKRAFVLPRREPVCVGGSGLRTNRAEGIVAICRGRRAGRVREPRDAPERVLVIGKPNGCLVA